MKGVIANGWDVVNVLLLWSLIFAIDVYASLHKPKTFTKRYNTKKKKGGVLNVVKAMFVCTQVQTKDCSWNNDLGKKDVEAPC